MLSSTTRGGVARNVPSTTLKNTMHTVDLRPRAGSATGPVCAYYPPTNAVHIVPSDPSYAATGRLHDFSDIRRVTAPELSKTSLVTSMYNDPLKYSKLDLPAVNEYRVASFYDGLPRDKASIALSRVSNGYGKFGGAPYNYGREIGTCMGLTNSIREIQPMGYTRPSTESVDRLLSSQYTLGSTAGLHTRDGCYSESALRNYSNARYYPVTMESYGTGRVNTLSKRRYSESGYTGLDFYSSNQGATLFKDTTYLRNTPFSGTRGLTAVYRNNF